MENQGLLADKTFKRLANVVLALVAVLLIVGVFSAFKEYRFIGGGVSATNVISVSGEGEVFAVPDVATFTFSVVAERQTAEEAQDESAEKVNDILSYLEEEGIEDKDVKTTNYNVYPRYEYRQVTCITYPCPSERVFSGFEVRQSVTVTVRDTSVAGSLLSGVGERGATDISGLSFTIEDEDALRSEAREKAIDQARGKAEELADQLGVRIVRVVSFNEYGAPRYYGVYEEAAYDSALGGAIKTSAPSVPVGENRILSNVTVTYEIR